MSTCRRTAGILDAWLDAGQLGERDARHLGSCQPCADAFARRDAFETDLRVAVRSLVLEPAAVGTGVAAPVWHPPQLRVGAGLASLVVVVVLVVVAGIRLSSAPATPGVSAVPLLPVAVGPAEQALHQSGLRCAEIAGGLECARRMSDGWQQKARLEVAGGAVRGLEVRLEPGTGVFPAGNAPAALSEPATDVLGVDLTEEIGQAVDAAGVACGCERPIDGGSIHLEGDPGSGYVLTVDVP